jgi:Phosphotransferase enzyme family
MTAAPQRARVVDTDVMRAIDQSFTSAVTAVHSNAAADGSYHSQILTVQLATGEEAKLFLKDFGAVRVAKAGVAERCAAEIGIYRHFLSRMALGTARYHASGPSDGHSRTWLLLDLVEGERLRTTPFDATWEAAADWLALLQAEVRARNCLEAAAFLPRHDRRFFAAEVTRAVQAAAGWSLDLATRLDGALTRYAAAVDLILDQPLTLVHGKFRNILVVRNGSGLRICPLDWEWAAIGVPHYDLAFLAEGLPESQVELLLRAYRSRAHALGLPTGAPQAFHCFRLHRALGLVRKASKRSAQIEGVAAAVSRVEQLAAEL